MDEILKTLVPCVAFTLGAAVGMLAVIGALVMFRYSKKNES